MTAKTGASNPETDAAKAEPAAQQPANTPQVSLSDQAVADFLRQNPDFFNNHPELLLELSIPHDSGKAISLLERQVAVFRDRQESMQAKFSSFMTNARENDALFEKTRLVVLDLLHCDTLLSLNATIEETLKADFDASASKLVFISDQDFPRDSVLRCLPSTAVKTALGELYDKQRTYCGPLNKVQQEFLFSEQQGGGEAPAIVSAAIVPLHPPEDSPIRERFGQPLLLIGSTEEQHFNNSLDTLFLDFIGEVLAAHLHNLAVAAPALPSE